MLKIYKNNVQWVLDEKDGKYILTRDDGTIFEFETMKEVLDEIERTEYIAVPFTVI